MVKIEKMMAKIRNDKSSSSNESFVDGAFDATAQYSFEIGVSLIVFGILCGFFGKKLVKPVSFLTGFLVGAGVSLGFAVLKLRSVASSSFSQALDPIKMAVISAAGGTVLGVLMLAFYKFIIYGILGGFISLISYLMVWEFSKHAPFIQYPIASATFIFGTFFASLIPTFSMIVVTSGLGSYLLAVGIDCIIKSGFNHIFAFGFGYTWSEVAVNTSDEVFGLMGFWIILFIWMGVRQLFAKSPVSDGKMKKMPKKNSVNGTESLQV